MSFLCVAYRLSLGTRRTKDYVVNPYCYFLLEFPSLVTVDDHSNLWWLLELLSRDTAAKDRLATRDLLPSGFQYNVSHRGRYFYRRR